MKVLLTTLNATYIHKNLALRWLYQACPEPITPTLWEFTLRDDMESIIERLCEGNFDIICFSVYIWNIEPIRYIIQELKLRQRELRILVGGPEVSYESFDLLDQGVDAISLGEGEQSVWEYVAMCEARQDYEISGIYTKSHPNQTQRKSDLHFLEQLANPYFMEMDRHDMGKRYLYLETSRGCPYGCTYCLSSCDKEVRLFSTSYVLDLLKQLSKSDVKQVKLLDRTFNCDPKRALILARYMNEHCIHQTFQLEVVADQLSSELLSFFLHEADPKRFRLEIGVQSFQQPTLHAVGRFQNNERLKQVIHALRQAHITMHVDLIAGLPYEDMFGFAQSFDTLFELHADELQLGILKLLKGTVLKQQAQAFGMKQEEAAPYSVQKTNWLNEAQLCTLRQCAQAVEKYWNEARCRYTIETLLDEHIVPSAFALFIALGKHYARLPHPYALPHLYQAFAQAVMEMVGECMDRHTLLALLNMDYYAQANQRLPHFHEDKLSKQERSALKQAAKDYGLSPYRLDHYAAMCYGRYAHKNGYLLILYDPKQKPQRYWCNEAYTEWKEFDHENNFACEQ